MPTDAGPPGAGGRVALITGAGRTGGIAAEVARRLARDGWDLALSFWHPYDERLGLPHGPSDPEALADEVRQLGRRAVLLPGDLADPAVPPAVVGRAAAELGPISGMVLAHCESVDYSFMDTTVAALQQHLSVNVVASWQLIHAFAEQFIGEDGRIVAFTSDHVVGNVPYGASKAALDRIMVAAAVELGPRGIRANAVSPGPTDTGWMGDAMARSLAARSPLGRVSSPADAAALTAFLLGEEGGWINGQVLTSDGGIASH